MSPRAACRLERFGFTDVYDYTAGIADWKAAGLSTDGNTSTPPTVADAMRADVPTCAPDDAIGRARRRTLEADLDECIVIDCDNIVVGRLRNQSWDSPDDVTAETAMESGPTTVRPDADLASLVERMSRRGTRLVVAATPQGQLLGTVSDTDARQLVAGYTNGHEWQDCDGCPGQRRATSGPQIGEDGAQ